MSCTVQGRQEMYMSVKRGKETNIQIVIEETSALKYNTPIEGNR